MKKKRGSIKTSIKDIIEYWMNSPKYANGDEVGMAIDQADLDVDGGRCWRCGTTKNIQRCHIIPHSQAGKDEPSNLLLLCRDCHNDAPNVSNATAEDFFNWMKNSRRSLEQYLHENNAGHWNMLNCYPPKGQRGEFWDLKVVEICIRDFDFNIFKERAKLAFSFHCLVNKKNPNPVVNVNSRNKENAEFMLRTAKVWNWIMHYIDTITQVSLHFKQEGEFSQGQANLQSEALANINNTKYIKSLMEDEGDNFISYLNEVIDEESLEEFNKELGFDFFFKKELTTSIH